MPHYPEDGAWPGVRSPNLSEDPLGTAGELTVGPDDLDPDKPRDREKLEALGFTIQEMPSLYGGDTQTDDTDAQSSSDADQMEGVDDWGLDWDAVSPLFDYGTAEDADDKPTPQLAFDPQSEDNDPFTLW